MEAPLISIVIPVKNGAPWLETTLSCIFSQTLISQTEVIVIDSGSTDGTLGILSRFPVRLITIPSETFNHGRTRNLGAKESRGKYVVMTVQDASAQDNRWLEHLVNGFKDDTVAGVCGQQIVPHDADKNPVDWFRPVSAPSMTRYIFPDKAAFDALPPNEQLHICRWDNVNAIYRRSVLLAIPFRDVSFAEDALWAKDALRNGYAIVYNPLARVLHYHDEDESYTFRRTFTVNYHFYKFFGVRPEPVSNGTLTLLSNIKLLLFEKKIHWRDKYRWVLFNIRQRAAANRSTRLFLFTLAEGEQKLDQTHTEVCLTPPQANTPGKKILS